MLEKRTPDLDKDEKKANLLGNRMESPMRTPLRTFGYKFSGYFMEYGPVEASSLEAAKAQIRKRLGVSRLPLGFQVWDLAERPLTRWRVASAS